LGTALAAARERPHSGGMANKNPFAIIGIAIAVIIGVIVSLGILGTILLFLYGIVVLVFRNAFGIELPHLF
jgi:hypothetical protein